MPGSRTWPPWECPDSCKSTGKRVGVVGEIRLVRQQDSDFRRRHVAQRLAQVCRPYQGIVDSSDPYPAVATLQGSERLRRT